MIFHAYSKVTVTKDAARLQTREDQMRRKRDLLAQISVEDEVASSHDPVVMVIKNCSQHNYFVVLRWKETKTCRWTILKC